MLISHTQTRRGQSSFPGGIDECSGNIRIPDSRHMLGSHGTGRSSPELRRSRQDSKASREEKGRLCAWRKAGNLEGATRREKQDSHNTLRRREKLDSFFFWGGGEPACACADQSSLSLALRCCSIAARRSAFLLALAICGALRPTFCSQKAAAHLDAMLLAVRPQLLHGALLPLFRSVAL